MKILLDTIRARMLLAEAFLRDGMYKSARVQYNLAKREYRKSQLKLIKE